MIAQFFFRLLLGLFAVWGSVLWAVSLLGTRLPTPQIIYQSTQNEHTRLYIHDLGRQVVLPLGRKTQAAITPVWSPDGTRIAYVEQDHFNMMDIYLINANGRHRHRLTFGPRSSYLPQWSPDGQQLVFSSNRSGNWDIYRMVIATGETVQLTHHAGIDDQPMWSPDGAWIVYRSTHEETGQHDLVLMDVNGQSVRHLTNDSARDAVPRWSPDGRALVWVTERTPGNPCLRPSDNRGGRGCGWQLDLYQLDLDSQTAIRLTPHWGYHWAPTYSSDGRQIIFTGADNAFTRSIYWMTLGDNQRQRLTKTVGDENFASWRPSVVVPQAKS